MKHQYSAQQATLKDIAQATKLTVATVSRILAGKASFATETKERVLATAEKLGYRPNRLVSGIQTGRTGTIGAIIPFHAEWGAQIITGLQQELAPHGYVPIALDCPSAVMSELEMIYHLLDRRVDGVVLFPGDDTISDDYFSEIHSRQIPLVVLNRPLINAHCHFVGCEDRKGGKLAANHLIQLGHRILGHLAGPWNHASARERADGFFEATMTHPNISVAQCIMPTFLPDEVAIEKFLLNHPSVTGIFCANEPIALGLYAVARRLGITIPDRLSVVSHGDGRAAKIISPPLTSTVEDSYTVGREAAKMLLKLIHQQRPKETFLKYRVPTRLVIRESTRKLDANSGDRKRKNEIKK